MTRLPPSPPLQNLRAALQRRAHARFAAASDAALVDLLAEAVFLERRRFSEARGGLSDADRKDAELIEKVARAAHKHRPAVEAALTELVDRYAEEIHNHFSPRTYRFATKILPGALNRLLTGVDRKTEEEAGAFGRIRLEGPIEQLRALAETHTLILAPTHLSNMDSPLIGYALYAAGLPPFIYGAGLNLFENPALGFFMSRLGAYTVDRRKKHRLYTSVLKDYSTESIGLGRHSLFFPGGTRARSGEVENEVKKGLLGTGIAAWQEGLRENRARGEVLVVPCTLSYAMVLEAETLIEDALKDSGKRRYIISDDEFSEPRTVATFTRQLLALDASVIVRFAAPLDLFGNPVDEAGNTLDRDGLPMDRRPYVCDPHGQVIADEQRDRVYTEALARSLVHAWHADNTLMETHVAAFAAWQCLVARRPALDTWQRIFLHGPERTFSLSIMRAAIAATLDQLDPAAASGRLRLRLPAGPNRVDQILSIALDRFGRFHREACLRRKGEEIEVAPKLALYYGNRLAHYGFETPVQHAVRLREET